MRTFLNNLPVNKAEDGSFKVLGGLSECTCSQLLPGAASTGRHACAGRTSWPCSGGGRSPHGRAWRPGPLACPGPRGPPGTPCIGVGFWLEGGAVWPVALLGFRERKQDWPTIPRRGSSRGGWVGIWHSGALGTQEPVAGWVHCLTHSKLLVTCGQGALRMGRMQRAGTQFLGSVPGPLQLHQSARPVGPPLPQGAQEPREPPPPIPTQGTGRRPRGNVQRLENASAGPQ